MATKQRVTKKAPPKKAAQRAGRAVRPATRGAPKRAARPARKRAKRKVAPIPKGYRTATPYLIVRGASEAIGFYQRAFGAREVLRLAMPNGTVMHAEIRIGDSMLMLSEENPAWGSKSPLTLGGSATHVMLYVKDVDAFFARAVAAGCAVEMPVADMFWGDRYGKLRDPYGHQWSVGTHVEDLSAKQMQRRADAEMAKMTQAPKAD
jgi:PhnB protein